MHTLLPRPQRLFPEVESKRETCDLMKSFSSISAGCFLAVACATVLSINTAPWYQENAPGLIRAIAALVFPFGLCMVILTGADLGTGSFMACSAVSRNVSILISNSSPL